MRFGEDGHGCHCAGDMESGLQEGTAGNKGWEELAHGDLFAERRWVPVHSLYLNLAKSRHGFIAGAVYAGGGRSLLYQPTFARTMLSFGIRHATGYTLFGRSLLTHRCSKRSGDENNG